MPAPTPTQIRECILSEAGENFGANNVSEQEVSDFGELDTDLQDDAIKRARSWCEGILNSITLDGLTDEEVNDLFEEVQGEIESKGGLESGEINQSDPDPSDQDTDENQEQQGVALTN